MHASMRKELRILSGIVRDFGPGEYPYELQGEPMSSEDFDDRVDIIPVSDPNAGTMAQRIMQYQAALQLAAQAPDMYDLPLLHRQMLDVLGIQDADDIVPSKEASDPADPVSENMAIINSAPVKAFIYQDHEAHIQTHMSMVQDPPPEEKLPDDIEHRLSQLVAPAAAQLLGKDQKEAEMQKRQEEEEDPILQMQRQELEIKQQEVQAKAQAEMAKINLDLQKLQSKDQLDQQRMDLQERIETAKLGAKIASENSKEELETRRIASKEQIEGTKIGVEIAKELMDE